MYRTKDFLRAVSIAWQYRLNLLYLLGTAVIHFCWFSQFNLNKPLRTNHSSVERCTIVVKSLLVFSFIDDDFCAKLSGTTNAMLEAAEQLFQKILSCPEGPSWQLRLILGLSEGLTLPRQNSSFICYAGTQGMHFGFF